MFKRFLILAACILIYLIKINAQDFHGVFVGISAYPYPNELPDDCVWDAQDMRSKLNQYYDWQLSKMILLTDEDGTKQTVRDSIAAMPRTSTKTDMFFFSGHGSTSGLFTVDEQYLSPSELQTSFGGSYNYYSSYLDACRSGIFTSSMSHGVISTACASNEDSYTGGPNGHSVYTAYLCQGLQNNYKNAEDLHYYAADLTTDYESSMHPQLGDYFSGKLFFKYTLSGSLTENETWIGPITLQGNITVPSGITLTIKPGATLSFNNGASLTINGTLTAQGTSSDNIVFDFGSPNSSTQNGIIFNSGSSGSVEYATIQNAYYGIYANNSNLSISNNTIQNNSTGIRLYSSNTNIAGSTIINNSNYGIQADNISGTSNVEFYNNTLQGNGYAMLLTNAAPYIYNNMMTDNSHGVVINSCSPSFSNLFSQPGYNAITCSVTPLFKAENSSIPYLGYDFDGGYNSIFGSELPDIEAVNNSHVYADNNYWGGGNAASYADGTSWILARTPLDTDPNPGSTCMGKISASKYLVDGTSVENEDIASKYWQANAYGNKKDFKTAKELLKSIISGKFDKKYSPLALLDFYSFSLKELQGQVQVSNSNTVNKDYNDLLKELYDRPVKDSLRPFAIRLLARDAALSNNFTDMVTYNTEIVNNYLNSSNELTALYDLVDYYNEVEHNVEKAKGYLTRMKAAYPDEDLTLFAQINLGEKVDINNRKISNENTIATQKELSLNNYPNPFNPTTMITYSLKEKDHVTLIVFDILGKEVAQLVDGLQTEGEHSISFDGSNLPSGMYIYQLKGTNFNLSRKMLLLK